MTYEKYKRLNNYLNIIFKELEKRDSFLLNNLEPIANTSNRFYNFISEYEFEEQNIENNLTYEDVYEMSREIIATIDEKYLPIYDKILGDGTLNFDYNSHGRDSYCNRTTINIARQFSYDDIRVLIHEFIHYTNESFPVMTINRHLLTEFISIYFEIYTQRYLEKKYNAPKESISVYFRLFDCKNCSKAINHYLIPLYYYFNYGNLNENSYESSNQFYENRFKNDCNQILKICKKLEQTYKMEILYEKKFDEEKLGRYLIDHTGIGSHYRYLLGTLLAYYAIENVDMKKMVQLNDFINTDECSKMSTYDLLYRFGIDLNEIDKVLNSIEMVLENKKKTR